MHGGQHRVSVDVFFATVRCKAIGCDTAASFRKGDGKEFHGLQHKHLDEADTKRLCEVGEEIDLGLQPTRGRNVLLSRGRALLENEY